MIALGARGVTLGAARVAAVTARVAAAADAVPGVTATVVDDGVVLSGAGLARRSLSDARLRDIAGWGR